MADGGFIIKTASEQKLEFLFQMQKHRRLTNDEWEQVRRAEHAIYQRIRRQELRQAETEERRAVGEAGLMLVERGAG